MVINILTLTFIILGISILSLVLYYILKPKSVLQTSTPSIQTSTISPSIQTSTISPSIQTSTISPISTPVIQQPIDQPGIPIQESTFTYQVPNNLCTTFDCSPQSQIEAKNEPVSYSHIIGKIPKTGLLTSILFRAKVTLDKGDNLSSYYIMIGSPPEPITCANSYCNGPKSFPVPLESDTLVEFTDTPQIYVNENDLVQVVMYSKTSQINFTINNVELSLKIV